MGQITKAMEMVSASQKGRAEVNAKHLFLIWKKSRRSQPLLHLAASGSDHPMLKTRPVKKTGYIVITADRGLAGSYNSNVLRQVNQTLQSRHKSNDEFAIIAHWSCGT